MIKEIQIRHTEYVIKEQLANEVIVDFEVFQVTGEVYSEMGVEFDPPRKCFLRKGTTSSMDTTCKEVNK